MKKKKREKEGRKEENDRGNESRDFLSVRVSSASPGYQFPLRPFLTLGERAPSISRLSSITTARSIPTLNREMLMEPILGLKNRRTHGDECLVVNSAVSLPSNRKHRNLLLKNRPSSSIFIQPRQLELGFETPRLLRLNSKIWYKCIRSNEGFAKGQRQTLISLRKDRVSTGNGCLFFYNVTYGESGTPSLPLFYSYYIAFTFQRHEKRPSREASRFILNPFHVVAPASPRFLSSDLLVSPPRFFRFAPPRAKNAQQRKFRKARSGS